MRRQKNPQQPARGAFIIHRQSETTPTIPEPRWELYAHGADVGIRGFGAGLAEAFEAIGLALTSVVCDLSRVQPSQAVEIHCAAREREGLLFEWVNAIVYEMAIRRMLFRRYRVSIVDCELTASLWGEALDSQRHEPAVEVKGATYTDLRVRQEESGLWSAQCIVDV